VIDVGSTTYILSPVDFAANPGLLLQLIQKYKIKDTYATSQMISHAMTIPSKPFRLHEVKNIMIAFDQRPKPDLCNFHCNIANLDSRVRNHFAPAHLDSTAINTTYSHVLNPMIVTRSYMCIEPIAVHLSTKALRRGIVQLSDPESDPYSLLLHDSGMVPICTQIAIVNPETCMLSRIGEFGEIWVSSEANVKGFYLSKDPFDIARMNARTVDGDQRITYVRTGDLGFLYNVSRPVGPGGALVDMQTLFVLGNIGETFELNGLQHFPIDIERTIEKSHRKIARAGRYSGSFWRLI